MAASSSARFEMDFDPGTLISPVMGRHGGATLTLRAMVLATNQAGTGSDLRATGRPMLDMSTTGTLMQAPSPGDDDAFFLSLKRAAVATDIGRESGGCEGSW